MDYRVSLSLKVIVLVNLYLAAQIFFISQPYRKIFNQLSSVGVLKQRNHLQIILFLILWQQSHHKRIYDIYDTLYALQLHSCRPLSILRRGGVLILQFLLVLGLFVSFCKLLVNGSSQHHEESEKNVKIIRLGQPFIDLRKELAKDIGKCLIVKLLRFIILRLLLLRIEVNIDLIKFAFHINLFEGAVIVPSIGIGYKIAKPIDTIGGNIFGIAIAVIDFFLEQMRCYCFWTSPTVGVF